jgi:hypothetical protein
MLPAERRKALARPLARHGQGSRDCVEQGPDLSGGNGSDMPFRTEIGIGDTLRAVPKSEVLQVPRIEHVGMMPGTRGSKSCIINGPEP